jgi:SET domain-containing protein
MLYIDTTDFKKVITEQAILANTPIVQLKGAFQDTPTRYTLQIDKDKHLTPYDDTDEESMGRLVWPYLNHSCSPNAYVDIKTMLLMSLGDISASEEITIDYQLTETNMKEPFECKCKSANCKGFVKGSNN